MYNVLLSDRVFIDLLCGGTGPTPFRIYWAESVPGFVFFNKDLKVGYPKIWEAIKSATPLQVLGCPDQP